MFQSSVKLNEAPEFYFDLYVSILHADRRASVTDFEIIFVRKYNLCRSLNLNQNRFRSLCFRIKLYRVLALKNMYLFPELQQAFSGSYRRYHFLRMHAMIHSIFWHHQIDQDPLMHFPFE